MCPNIIYVHTTELTSLATSQCREKYTEIRESSMVDFLYWKRYKCFFFLILYLSKI
jgi:hypothetical protein